MHRQEMPAVKPRRRSIDGFPERDPDEPDMSRAEIGEWHLATRSPEPRTKHAAAAKLAPGDNSDSERVADSVANAGWYESMRLWMNLPAGSANIAATIKRGSADHEAHEGLDRACEPQRHGALDVRCSPCRQRVAARRVLLRRAVD